MKNNDIQIINQNDEYYVDSRIVAAGFGIEHHSLCKSLQQRFIDLKSVNISDSVKPGRPGTYYLLTERQTMIIPSICKSTDKTFEFQCALVDAFLLAKKKLSEIDPIAQLATTAGIARLLEIAQDKLRLEGEVLHLKTHVGELEPKAKYHDYMVATKDWLPLWDFGKASEIGSKKIFEFCRSRGYLYYSNNKLVPKQGYIDSGLFVLKEYIYKDPKHGDKRGYKVYVSGKGQSVLLSDWHKYSNEQMRLL
jgi:phage antirepressor YoqD-like protein